MTQSTGKSDGRSEAPVPSSGAPSYTGQECFLAILRAADVISQALGAPIDGHGITGQQYNVLRILRGSHPEGLATLEIGDRMIQRQSNVTRLMDRLEDKELVVRARSSEDRRIVRCWISDAGLALLAEMDRPMVEATNRVFRCLTPDARSQLVTLLDRLCSAA